MDELKPVDISHRSSCLAPQKAHLGHQLLSYRQLDAPPLLHERIPSPQTVQEYDLLSIALGIIEISCGVGRDMGERRGERLKKIRRKIGPIRDKRW